MELFYSLLLLLLAILLLKKRRRKDVSVSVNCYLSFLRTTHVTSGTGEMLKTAFHNFFKNKKMQNKPVRVEKQHRRGGLKVQSRIFSTSGKWDSQHV